MSMLECLRLSARARGFPIQTLESDERTALRFEASEVHEMPKALSFGTFPMPFYPVLLRWVNDDGTRCAMRVDPVVKREGGRPRLDWAAMGERFLAGLYLPTIEVSGNPSTHAVGISRSEMNHNPAILNPGTET